MRVVGTVPDAIVARLSPLERAKTLEDVLAWAHANDGHVLDVIVQDEFTHDVILRTTPAFVVFDTT